MLYPDWTLLLQMGLFLLVYGVLSRTLFRPYLRLQDLREEATAEPAAGETEVLSQEAEELARRRRELAEEIGALRERLLTGAAGESAELLGKARSEAAARIQEANRHLDEAYENVARSLAQTREETVAAIVSRLLGAAS